jgi:anti-sigma factor RsiW
MKGHIEEEKIALLAGGDLKAEEADDLAGHIAACPACSARLKSYQEGRRAFASLWDTGISESDFDQVRWSVLHRLQEERMPRFWLATPMRWGALAAAIVMVVAMGTWWRFRMPAVRVSSTQGLGSGLASGHIPEFSKANVPENEKRPAQAIKRPRIAANAVTPSSTTVHVLQSGDQPAFAQIDPSPAAPVESKPVLDRIAIKLETPDPNVIIIWLASSEEKIR